MAIVASAAPDRGRTRWLVVVECAGCRGRHVHRLAESADRRAPCGASYVITVPQRPEAVAA